MGWKFKLLVTAAIISASANFVFVGVVLWFGQAFRDNLEIVRRASVSCIPAKDPSFDQLSAVAAMGRFDVVSAMFAGFAIILALAGFFGITIFRREVLGETKDEIHRLVPDEVRRIAQQLYPKNVGNGGGDVYTPSDVPYMSSEDRGSTDADSRPAGDDTATPEPSAGSSGGDGARSRP